MEAVEGAPARALVIMAHPDDPEFTAGGTIAAWRRQGTWVGYVICTGGDKGSEDPALPAAEIIRTREEEQRRAGRRLGVETIEDKIAAMLEHTSQVKDQAGLANLFRTLAQTAGAAARPNPLVLAEAFGFISLSR